MDDDENKPNHRHQRCRGWQFTFFGETSNSLEKQENQTELAAELTQNKLLFPLSSTQVGDRLIIAQILSGKTMMRQLSKRGLTLGVEVRVISKVISVKKYPKEVKSECQLGKMRKNVGEKRGEESKIN